MSKERNIHRDKKIDRYQLDVELELQPTLYDYWAEKAADAKTERDLLRVELKKKEAQVLLQVHTGKYPLPRDEAGKPIKVTGPVAEAIVNQDEQVVALREELAEVEREANVAMANEETMQQRRSSLKHLTELFQGQYWHQASAGRDTRSVRTDKAGDNARKGLNSRKKSQEE